MRSKITTWADGFGRWYVSLPDALYADPYGAARRIIRDRINARQGHQVTSKDVRVEVFDRIPNQGITIYRERD